MQTIGETPKPLCSARLQFPWQMLRADRPALVLAPMEGITDAPMRALQGEIGAFTFAVTEFLRVSIEPLPARVVRRDVPELETGCRTKTGLPVQVQLLGGDADLMATTAQTAASVGASAIDINFGCPAKTVNRHDGGATLLKFPSRIREIVRAVRDAVPAEVPVSAKLRLGWDDIRDVHENAQMAAEGGAAWITIHARTRVQGYAPPVFWTPIGEVRRNLDIPVVANGDIWNLDDFQQCQDETGCRHFMLGRSALSHPNLSWKIAEALGTSVQGRPPHMDWRERFERLVHYSEAFHDRSIKTLLRLKQWASFASKHGDFDVFDAVKRAESLDEFFEKLESAQSPIAICS